MKECYKVPSEFTPTYHSHLNIGNHIDDDDDPVEGPNIPLTLSEPLTSHNPKPRPPDIPILIGVEDEQDKVQHDSSSQSVIFPGSGQEIPLQKLLKILSPKNIQDLNVHLDHQSIWKIMLDIDYIHS